jgi:hypothetical protein
MLLAGRGLPRAPKCSPHHRHHRHCRPSVSPHPDRRPIPRHEPRNPSPQRLLTAKAHASSAGWPNRIARTHALSAAAPRPSRADRGGLPPPRRGTRRKGSGRHALTTSREENCPPAGKPVTVSQEITRPPERISSRPLIPGPQPVHDRYTKGPSEVDGRLIRGSPRCPAGARHSRQAIPSGTLTLYQVNALG